MKSRLSRIPPRWSIRQHAELIGSPFSVPAKQLTSRTKELWESGQLLACYVGHAIPEGMISGGRIFFNSRAFSDLDISDGAGVLLSCGCETLALGVPDRDGHGFAAMRAPKGPAAVIGAEDLSYAAMGMLAFDGLVRRLLDEPAQGLLLADWWDAVLDGIATAEIPPGIFSLMDQHDGSGGTVPLAEQRKEHLQMWMLLGDPAMRLPIIAETVSLAAVPDRAVPGGEIKVKVRLPDGWAGGKLHITTEQISTAKPRSKPGNGILAEGIIADAPARCTATITLPQPFLDEAVLVRVLAEGDGKTAHGVVRIPVEQEK